MQKTVRYPIGIQTFSEIVNGDYLYIDKTEFVYTLAKSLKYAFLSRPRRFGKSLLVSTLQAYFEGRKELFQGLAMEKLENEWKQHPVLRFDMSTAKHCDVKRLESELNIKLLQYEAIYGKGEGEIEPNQRLMGLIERAHKATGHKVVVLIDEYDAPLLDVVHEETNLAALRQVMRNFYSPLKFCDPYLRFVFLTGITKFSQLSIFSELNNIKNISMDTNYAAICGITEQEMITCMDEGITELAKEQGLSKEKAIKALKDNYDGYHFTWPSPDIYNPFSLLNALNDSKIEAYWFGSGTPTYLIEMLRKYKLSASQLCDEQKAKANAFDAPTEKMVDILPLLYQSGYYTIKGCNARGTLFTLGIPNREIRIGLLESLLPNYVGAQTTATKTTAEEMQDALLEDDIDSMFSLLQRLLKAVPYTRDSNHEGNYQQLLAVIFMLLGASSDVEVHTSNGRIDLVVMTETKRYLIEVKMDKDAQTALSQIELKDYESKYSLSTLPIVKVGVNFSSEERNITDWMISEDTTNSTTLH